MTLMEVGKKIQTVLDFLISFIQSLEMIMFYVYKIMQSPQ